MRNRGRHLARLVREGRLAHPLTFSQKELSTQLKLHSQGISNLERGLNSLNMKHVIKISKILSIPLEKLKKAMVQDYEDALNKDIWDILDRDNGVELREESARVG